MDLRQLEVFCKVVELKSFSKAAEAVFLTQPTVSQHISALEGFFDVQLIDRLGREIRPTHAGELLYQHAKEILGLRDKAYQSMHRFLGKKSGHLHIGASTIPGEYILPGILGQFKQVFPEISVTLHIADTQQIVESVLESRVEIGIVGAKINNPQLTFHQFVEDRIVLIVGKGSSLWERSSINPAELMDASLIQREEGSGTKIAIVKALSTKGVDSRRMKIIAEMGSTESVKQAIIAGIGVSFLSERAVEREVAFGLLKKLPIKGIDIRRNFYIILNKKRSPSPLCRELKSFLFKHKQ
jgi:DNA-binding transcriptional LysR family regulator